MKLVRKQRDAKIPSDSMADIAFLLIIFFMLTTTFSVNKGFDYGIPPAQESEAPSESIPALTIIVDARGNVSRDYRIIVVDQNQNQREFSRQDIALSSDEVNVQTPSSKLYRFMEDILRDVKVNNPEEWQKLPIYILVRRNAPFEGFVDVWQNVKWLEERWKKRGEFPSTLSPEDQKLSTHIPHVNQVELMIQKYLEEGSITL